MTNPRRLVLTLLLTCAVATNGQERTGGREREPVVGLPCEGCEAVFEGMPESLPWRSRIVRDGEEGEPMRIAGTVVTPDRRPAPGVIVYAYQTNAKGIYPTDDHMRGRAAYRHGRLRAWAKTDEKGWYLFESIRPAPYPGTDLPAHVHMHVIEVGSCTYTIDDIHFEDDPRLTPRMREQVDRHRGGSGLVHPHRDERGVLTRNPGHHPGREHPGTPVAGVRGYLG